MSMRIDTAIRLLKKYYEQAIHNDYIKNKVAWALYQTWKEADNQTWKEADKVESEE